MTARMKRTVAAAAGLIVMMGVAWATEPLVFKPHGRFFSTQTKQSVPIDPQVFVAQPGVPSGTGPQEIKHAAGFRPARLEADPPSTPLYNVEGKALGFTLGEWLDARGTATLTLLEDGGETVSATFTGLRPGGVYSLFENHFDTNPISFTPLDGQGTMNNFRADADGDATVMVTAPKALTHDNAVLLVYHGYGASRGQIGVTTFHQLIARPAN